MTVQKTILNMSSASVISFEPTPAIAASDVQSAIEAVDAAAASAGANTDITSVVLANGGLKFKDSDGTNTITITTSSNPASDITLTLVMTANRNLTISGNTAVNQNLRTTDGPQFATIELGHASDTTIARDAAGLISVEGSKVLLAGKQTIWIPASSMLGRTTNGAAFNVAETTNKNLIVSYDFDASTQEFVQFEIHLPKSWNLGTVTFQPVWSHAATATNFGVVWELAAVARSDDDAGDVAFGTAQSSTDTGGTTNDIYIGPESSAITIAGTPASGDTVQFQLARAPANASDTLAVDARLHGLRLFYTSNAATDA